MNDIPLTGVEVYVGDYKMNTDNVGSAKFLTILINVVTNMLLEEDRSTQEIRVRLHDKQNGYNISVIIETSPRAVEDAYMSMDYYINKQCTNLILSCVRNRDRYI